MISVNKFNYTEHKLATMFNSHQTYSTDLSHEMQSSPQAMAGMEMNA